MKYAQLREFDTTNGPGVRVSLFVSGCTLHCKGCFNDMAWPFNYGKEYTKETENKILESLKPDYIKGLSILGGEPMEPENQAEVWTLIKRVRKELPKKDIWVYSGYLWEELTGKEKARCRQGMADRIRLDNILQNIDVLVDGEFQEDKKNIMLEFRGSENQRIIDVKKTLETGEVVLLEVYDWPRGEIRQCH